MMYTVGGLVGHPHGGPDPIVSGVVEYRRRTPGSASGVAYGPDVETAPVVEGVVEDRTLAGGDWIATVRPDDPQYRPWSIGFTLTGDVTLAEATPITVSGETWAKGEPGLSAYDLAVEGGFVGSVAAWLESLRGRDGRDGSDGAPGRDGADGAPGQDGQDGKDGDRGEPGHSPTVTMTGDQITVDGTVIGPHLTGPAGADSTVPGPPGPVGPPGKDSTVPGPAGPRGDTGAPGAVPTPSDYLVVGPGRPDQPSSTGGLITGAEKIGAEYRSTDGAGVGAWVWRKRDTGWQVTDGHIARLLAPGVTIWRTGSRVTVAVQGTKEGIAPGRLCALPDGFRPWGDAWTRPGAPVYRHGNPGGNAHIYVAGDDGAPQAWPRSIHLVGSGSIDHPAYGSLSFETAQAWPITPPGTPAPPPVVS